MNGPQVNPSHNDSELEALWDWNFTNHKPSDDGIKKIETLREGAKDFAEIIIKLCPNSRERALGLTNLENTLFNAISSIARYDPEEGKHPGAKS